MGLRAQIAATREENIQLKQKNKQLEEQVTKLKAELDICKDLRHPHIVRYLGHEYMDAKLCIKLEFVPGGSLLALLSEFGPLEGVMMQTASRGLVEGLNYLHTHNPPVVHRDIKGANVLVDTDFCVKLADFGCSKRSSDTQSFVTIGSVPWMAPEVINQKSGHGRKADIWSLGCTLIEMATAEKPWGADKFNNIMFALQWVLPFLYMTSGIAWMMSKKPVHFYLSRLSCVLAVGIGATSREFRIPCLAIFAFKAAQSHRPLFGVLPQRSN